MNAAPTLCNCCREVIRGKSCHDKAAGEVCRSCAHDLTVATKWLFPANLRGLYLGDCPDNRKGGAQ